MAIPLASYQFLFFDSARTQYTRTVCARCAAEASFDFPRVAFTQRVSCEVCADASGEKRAAYRQALTRRGVLRAAVGDVSHPT